MELNIDYFIRQKEKRNMSERIEDKNIEQLYEENEQFDDYDDLEEEYGEEPTYQRMNKQKGLKKMRW